MDNPESAEPSSTVRANSGQAKASAFFEIYSFFLLFTQPYSLRKGETKQQKDVGAMC